MPVVPTRCRNSESARALTKGDGDVRLGNAERVMQLVDGPVYMHQYKVNAKAAFDGDVWQWHQDYGTWARDDGMPAPRAMNIAVFVDDVTAANGPLLFIPGSHKSGVLDAGHDLATTSYPLWTLDRETVTKLADRGGCVAPTGPAGSVLVLLAMIVFCRSTFPLWIFSPAAPSDVLNAIVEFVIELSFWL